MNAENKQTRETAIAALKSCEGYGNIELHEEASGAWSGTHANGLPVRIVGSDETGWYEVHGGICSEWLLRGGPNGVLGLPVSNEENDPDYRDPNGKRSRFQHGVIHGWPLDPGQPNGAWNFATEMDDDGSSLQLPDAVRQALASIDGKLSEIEGAIQSCVSDDPTLGNVLDELRRRRRSFDSKAFFIVTFGMLKAGKSTLVNTFVGKEVSPVGRSKETTLRSSIVLAADADNPEGIYLYSPRSHAQTEQGDDPETKMRNEMAVSRWRADCCRLLVERLNGLVLDEEFLAKMDESRELFSVERLEYILTTETLPDFPNILPPVIRIDTTRLPEGLASTNLLREGVAILDTPGLDGALSNAKRDPFWEVLPSNGDYFLLVQSSMSAINKECLDLILSIYKATDEAPILVIFNEIAANFWDLPEVEKEKLRKDSETASRQLSDRLREKLGGKIPARISINAGEASDSIFGKCEEFTKGRKEMLDESRLVPLRERILGTLRNERVAIKVRNSKARLLDAVKKGREAFESKALSLECEANERREKKTEIWRTIQAAADQIANAFRGEGDGVQIARALGTRMESWLCEQFDQSVIGTMAPAYREYKGKPKPSNENTDYHNGHEVRTGLEEWIQSVNASFGNILEAQFVDHGLRVKVAPWDSKIAELADVFQKLTDWKGKIFNSNGPAASAKTGKDDRFPESFLFSGFEESAFLEPFRPKDKDVEVDRVGWAPHRNRTYGSDSVWECKCARAVQSLTQKLESHFPKTAATKTAKRLEKAIIANGENYAKELAERVKQALDKDCGAEDAWQKTNGAKVSAVRDAVRCLDEIERILAEV